MTTDRILIAGAGPVGLITALVLARDGIPVTVLERADRLLDDPRAATTHPATLELLDRIGLVEQVTVRGLVSVEFHFRDRPTDELVAEFDHSVLKNDTKFPYVVQCEQFKLAEITLGMLRDHPECEVLFEHEVTGAVQDDDGVTVTVNTPDGQKDFKGRYLVGADGGRSVVRKSFGIDFEGFTYPERFVVLTTPFDFKEHRDYSFRTYIADPDEWCNCFKVAADGPPGLWRTVFPARETESEDQILGDEGVQARLQRFFPKDTPYEVVHRNLYVTHQRVASTFRTGRVMLAGDSAHINNPIGGMGLNGGIQDAVNLGEKLARVFHGTAPDRDLDLYDRQRRLVTIEFVQQQTIQNKKRLEENDPDVRRRNLDELRAIARDPERARDFVLRSSMIALMRRADEIGRDT